MKIKLQSLARQKTADPVMEELFAGYVTIDDGLSGDLSVFTGAGEVSILSKESWTKVCHEADIELPWLAHGANLLIRGFEFLPTDIGRTVHIGETVLEITRESNPHPMLESYAPTLYNALQTGWRGGVVCRVLRSGSVQTGDDVKILG